MEKMICVPLQIVYNLGNCLKTPCMVSWLEPKDRWIYRPSPRKITLGQILHAVPHKFLFPTAVALPVKWNMAVKMSDATHERLYDVEIAANFASASTAMLG